VEADCVGSRQMQAIRKTLREKATVLMGKNTLAKKAIRKNLKKFPKMEKLMPHIKGNIGFVFVKGEDVAGVRQAILDNKVSAPAKAGAISPMEVIVPAGNTGLEPTKTSFFQALNIPTKITRGCVDILSPFAILSIGDKVGNSEAALLQMLNIRPFHYGLRVLQVYDDGLVYPPDVLDVAEEDIDAIVKEAMGNVSALAMATNYPTQLAVPYAVAQAFQTLLSIAVGTDINFEAAKELKALLSDPEALAAAQAAAAAQASGAGAAKEEAKEEEAKAEEEEEESEEDMGFGLFD